MGIARHGVGVYYRVDLDAFGMSERGRDYGKFVPRGMFRTAPCETHVACGDMCAVGRSRYLGPTFGNVLFENFAPCHRQKEKRK